MTEIYLKVFLLQSPRYNLSFFKNKNYSLKDLKLVFVDLESLDELSKEDNNCQSVIILPSSDDFNALLSLDANSINVVAYGNLQDLKNKPIDVENTNFTGLIFENITKEDQVFTFRLLLKGIEQRFLAYKRQSFLESMIDGMPEMVWFKDTKGSHMLVNKKFCRTVHKNKDEIRGRGHYYIWDITPDEYAKGEFVCMESEQEVLEKRHTCVFEEHVLTSEGMKHFMTYKTPLNLPNGELWGTVGIAYNLSDYSNLGVEMSYVFESLPYPIVVRDSDGVASFINNKFKKAFDIENLNVFDYKTWIQSKFEISTKHLKQNQEHAKNSDGKVNTLVYKVHKEERYFRILESEIHDYFGNCSGYYNVFEDVTNEELYRLKIQDLANKDPLTNLFNRRYFMEYLTEHKKEKKTIIFIDLDYFKKINDEYSHNEGDKLLKTLAKNMIEMFPTSLCARLGGDEFSIIFDGQDDEATKLSHQLGKKYRQYTTQKFGEEYSVSYGVITFLPDEDIDTAMHRADIIMYRNKEEHHANFRDLNK